MSFQSKRFERTTCPNLFSHFPAAFLIYHSGRPSEQLGVYAEVAKLQPISRSTGSPHLPPMDQGSCPVRELLAAGRVQVAHQGRLSLWALTKSLPLWTIHDVHRRANANVSHRLVPGAPSFLVSPQTCPLCLNGLGV